MYYSISVIVAAGFFQLTHDFLTDFPLQAGEAMHQTGPQGVPEDCHRHSHWLRHHGLHRLLRQAHSHPHQQHYCRGLAPTTRCI